MERVERDDSAPRSGTISSRTMAILLVVGVVAIGCAMFLDVPVATRMHTLEFPMPLKSVLRVLRLPGDYLFTVVLAAIIAARFRSCIRFAIDLLIVTAIASGVAAILKWSFGRNRPFKGLPAFEWSPFPPINAHTQYGALLSFPSGDSTLAFATAAMLARAFPRWAPLAYGWAIVVAVTRVVQRAHYPADVTAGAVLGIAVVYLIAPRLEAHHAKSQRRMSPISNDAD